MIKPTPGSERLKSFADRINRLLDEKQGIGADIGDIYTEAKSAGYVPKVLRKAIARQRMDADKRQEEDSILELYEAALDGPTREAVKLAAQGASAREIEAATGIDQATVARSVSLKKKRETQESCGGVESRHAGASGEGDLGPCESMTCEASDRAGDNSRPRGISQPPAGVAPGPQDLTIPDFLRRERARA